MILGQGTEIPYAVQRSKKNFLKKRKEKKKERKLSSQPLPAPRVWAASTLQKKPRGRPNGGSVVQKQSALGFGFPRGLGVGFGPIWTTVAGPSATRGRCVLSHQPVHQKVHPSGFNTFFSD